MNIYLSEIIKRMMRIDRGGARLLTLPAPTYSREVLEFDDYICEQLEIHEPYCEQLEIHEPYVEEPWADGSNDEEDPSNSDDDEFVSCATRAIKARHRLLFGQAPKCACR